MKIQIICVLVLVSFAARLFPSSSTTQTYWQANSLGISKALGADMASYMVDFCDADDQYFTVEDAGQCVSYSFENICVSQVYDNNDDLTGDEVAFVSFGCHVFKWCLQGVEAGEVTEDECTEFATELAYWLQAASEEDDSFSKSTRGIFAKSKGIKSLISGAF